MTGLDDLQADLDALADDIDRILCHPPGCTCGICDLAARLRHLLDDRGIDQAPLTSEIIAWLEADPDHVAEWWNARAGVWAPSSGAADVDLWRARLGEHGDQRQYGYRLATREPATERVRLDQCLLREVMWNGHRRRIVGVDTSTGSFKLAGHGSWMNAAPDGTVEVLKANP